MDSFPPKAPALNLPSTILHERTHGEPHPVEHVGLVLVSELPSEPSANCHFLSVQSFPSHALPPTNPSLPPKYLTYTVSCSLPTSRLTPITRIHDSSKAIHFTHRRVTATDLPTSANTCCGSPWTLSPTGMPFRDSPRCSEPHASSFPAQSKR
jgi:hypothetical protein